MKILLFPSAVDLAGVSTHVFNLAKLLNEDGLLDAVICPDHGWLSERLEENRIPHVIVRLSYRPRAFLSSSLALLRFLQSRPSADIVHVHGRFPLFISALSLVRGSGLIFVTTVHQFAHPASAGRFGWKSKVETFLLRRMSRICCVSEDLKEEVLCRIGDQNAPRVDVIPNWIEPLGCHANAPVIPPRPRRDGPSSIKICAIGRLSVEKGLDVLVRSLAILRSHGYLPQCDIFGTGPEQSALRKLTADAGLRDAVRFREPSGEVRRLLPTYDILVIPSRSESFGLVALEAYDASVPVIASDVPGLRKTVLDGKTGLLFESGSSTSLAAAVERLMQSEPLAGELIAGGKRYLQEYMPNDRLRSECREFYRKALLEDNRSGRPPYRFAGAGGAAAEPMKRRPESRRYVLRASTAASMLPRPD